MTIPASQQLDVARSIGPLSLPLSVVSIVFGSLSRWLFLTGEAGRIHADEAVSGLMARSLLDGDWSTFFWGQYYGGSVELLWLSPAMALVGDAALGVIPIVEAVVLCILVWRYCSHFLNTSDAVLAASLVWATPALWQWFSLRPMLFYQSTLIIGFSTIAITRLDMAGSEQKWGKLITSPCIATSSKRPKRIAVIALLAGDDMGSLRRTSFNKILPRQFQRCFNGF